MIVLHHSLFYCVEIASMPRNRVYLTVFNTIMSPKRCWGGRRLNEPVSNLPDDKNDFPYVLFLIKVTFIFYWYKMCNLFFCFVEKMWCCNEIKINLLEKDQWRTFSITICSYGFSLLPSLNLCPLLSINLVSTSQCQNPAFISLFFITAMFFSSRCINVLQFCSIIFN